MRSVLVGSWPLHRFDIFGFRHQLNLVHRYRSLIRLRQNSDLSSSFRCLCGNVGKLLYNLKFTLKMENEVMGLILDDRMNSIDAAQSWLKENPEVLPA